MVRSSWPKPNANTRLLQYNDTALHCQTANLTFHKNETVEVKCDLHAIDAHFIRSLLIWLSVQVHEEHYQATIDIDVEVHR